MINLFDDFTDYHMVNILSYIPLNIQNLDRIFLLFHLKMRANTNKISEVLEF